jgi:isomerase DpgB
MNCIETILFSDDQPSAAIIARINEACDRAADSNGGALLVFRIIKRTSIPDDGPPFQVTQTLIQWERTLRRLEGAQIPTIAIMETDCFDAVFELVLASDVRLALPHVKIGLTANSVIWPSMGVYRLVSQLGIGKARQLILFGATYDAEHAQALGLIDCATSSPQVYVADFIQLLGSQTLRDLAVRRRLMLEAPSLTYEDALGGHLAACERTSRSNAVAPLRNCS